MKESIYTYFSELLLAFLFIGLVVVTVHLMHKSDAGGNDLAFITWAENAGSMLLGVLIGIVQKKAGITTTNTTEPPKS